MKMTRRFHAAGLDEAKRPRARRRVGLSLVDMMVAIALLGFGLVPLFELVRANAASVRPRETETKIARFMASCLERVAAAPRRSDPLQIAIARNGTFRTSELSNLARMVLGTGTEALVKTFEDKELTLQFTRTERAGDVDGLVSWVVQASWRERDGKHERTQFRLALR